MIKLVSVVGHGSNLLPHFINHYNEFVDEVNLVVYESDIHKNLYDEVIELISSYDNVKVVKRVYDRKFDWHKVTNLYNEVKSSDPDGWWVVADIDEFHLYPHNDLYKLIQLCEKRGYEIVRGGFIDRIGPMGHFVELESNKSIFEQFPNAGFFRYPLSKACPNKICVMKGSVEISDGQHYAVIDGETTWKWRGWSHPLIAPHNDLSVQVHHFKWDMTSIDRIKNVADNNTDYSYSDEYRLMFNNIQKNNFKIDLTNPDFMFCKVPNPDFNEYKKWNKLINKIVSI